MNEIIHTTREAWLTAAYAGLAPWFVDVGKPITSPVRLAMGFPSSRALSLKKRTIGECWSIDASSDGHAEILISPFLDDPMEILGVVAHELGHAVLGGKVGHRAPFAKLMKELGLDGKATATYPGDMFKVHAEPLLETLGQLPHSKLNPNARPKKKDGIRQLKCECGTCGYIARTTKKWLDLGGPPLCPIDVTTMTCEGFEDDE